MYETVEDLAAHSDWNSLQPRLTQSHPVRTDSEQVTVPGLTSFVKPGDIVLIVAGNDPADEKVKQVLRVTSEPKNNTTTFDVTTFDTDYSTVQTSSALKSSSGRALPFLAMTSAIWPSSSSS